MNAMVRPKAIAPAKTPGAAAGLLLASNLIGTSALAQELEEILVTAQKRQETMQDVAIAVTVFTDEDLRELGIREPLDLAMQTPGLITAVGRDGLKSIGFYMRGVGITDFSGTIDSSVAVYVDEVFKTSPDMFNFAIFDIERVEVLKGPQGTLYGRNSTGGAVNFISASPTEETEGYLLAGYESFDIASAEGALSGSFSETLRGRFAIAGQRGGSDSGYSFNRFRNDELGTGDSLAIRAQVEWLPQETVDFRLIYTYGDQDERPPLLAHVGGVDAEDLANGIVRVCDPVLAGRREEGTCVGLTGYFDSDDDFYDGAADVDQRMEIEAHNLTGKLEWQLPSLMFTAISGYDDFEKKQSTDIDISPDIIANKDSARSTVESFSQELRLASDESWAVNWIVGAYYFESDIDWFQTIDLTDAAAVETSNGAMQDTESWALFGNISVPIGKFELEGGVRFTHEEREWTGGSFVGTLTSIEEGFASSTPPLSALPIPPSGTLDGAQPEGALDFENNLEEDKVDYRAAVKYNFSDDAMVYAGVSEGFRSGGIPSAVIFSQAALEPFDIETLRSYEAGFKIAMANRRAELQASAFFYDYEGYQATFVRGAEPSSRLQNAGDVEIMGLELALRWLVTENLLIDGGISLLDNEIVRTDVTLPPLDGSGPATTIEGNEVANAPSYSVNGRARYQLPLLLGVEPTIQLDFKYLDDHFLEPNNRAILEQDGYLLVNGRLSVKQQGGGWEGAIWIKNIADEEYVVSGEDLFLALGQGTWVLGAPRTYGVQIGYRF
jgi:iron complex outermembrane receptor protein